jgi:protoheme IX farnesyltransferase
MQFTTSKCSILRFARQTTTTSSLRTSRTLIGKLLSTRTSATLVTNSPDSSRFWSRQSSFFTNNQTLGQLETKLLDQRNSIYTELERTQTKHEPESWPPPTIPLQAYKPVPPLTLGGTLKIYSQLAKSRLTFLNVLAAMSGVALSPLPVSVPVLLATATGTMLCSASANTFNQLSEVPFDAQMARTRNRPIIRKAISPLHAAAFGVTTGIVGPAILLAYTNPVTAALGFGNIILYSGIYTALKRRTIVNTWVGAVVGAVPPLMGWTACGGSLIPSSTTPLSLYLPPFLSSSQITTYISSLPSWMSDLVTTTPLLDNPLAPLALFLFHFSWQFPHFNAFSHYVRSSYAQAGYAMLAVTDPKKNALVSLRHAVLLIGISSVLIPLSGLTEWTFALTSLAPNAFFLHWSHKFWKYGGDKTARSLFAHSLWYLPVMLGLMMYHKRGTDWLSWLGLREATVSTADEVREK